MTSLGFAPLSAHTVLFEATAQLSAVMLPVPLSEIPLPVPLSAMTQPGALALISAWELALTGNVALVVSTCARSRGTLLDAVTCTALLPSPVGEFTIGAFAAVMLNPFSDAILTAAELAEVLELVEL